MENHVAAKTPVAHELMAILIEDVAAASNRLAQADNQTHRRDFVRTVFAAVDGMVWTFRQFIVEIAKDQGALSKDEQRALDADSISLSPTGRLHRQEKFLPVLSVLRLVCRIAQKIDGSFSPRFDSSGWNSLNAAIKVRNRITHPKHTADLQIDDAAIENANAGFDWLATTCLDGMEFAVAAEGLRLRFARQLLSDLVSGDPQALAAYEKVRQSLGE